MLRIEKEGRVAKVVLDRPDKHNALNAELIQAITDAFRQLSTDASVKVVSLSGEGKSFCAGADLNYMAEIAAFGKEENYQDSLRLADAFESIAACPKPVVAYAHGACLGGGAGLLAACDYVVSALDAQFGFTEARLGLAPSVISPYVVRKIGIGHARALFLSAERFDAETALRIGLVNRLGDSADEVVRMLLENGPVAMAAIKKLLSELPSWDSGQAREETARLIANLRSGDEGQDGMKAFLERRKPRYQEE
ncbi:MAG: enoyl-CoA hydratase/isomerase family protein [Armatimonadetes bacterium]|nr:enoyl-CoA hydratase/isomerase family protein [Armatimonadota bacterium]